MIYVTGDRHGDLAGFERDILPVSGGWTEKDLLLIAGDFGFVFAPSPTPEEERALDFLRSLPYTIAFVDGNHENFPRLAAFPLGTFAGSPVHILGDRLFHLMRGFVYTLSDEEGILRVLAMGGALSVDRHLRREGISYWKEEIPNAAERAKCVMAARRPLDYVITHAAPASCLRRLGIPSPDPYSQFLEDTLGKVPYRKWYFGHIHMDRDFSDRQCCVYHRVLEVRTGLAASSCR